MIGTRLSVFLAAKNGDLEMVSEDPVNEERPKAIHSVQLTFDQIKALVKANNKSGLSDDLIIAMAWKESSFIPGSKNSNSTAAGLLQMEVGAIRELRRIGQWSGGFDVFDPAENIAAGSLYLTREIHLAGGNLVQGLDKYGGRRGYATDILRTTQDLQKNPSDPMQVLKQEIHR